MKKAKVSSVTMYFAHKVLAGKEQTVPNKGSMYYFL